MDFAQLMLEGGDWSTPILACAAVSLAAGMFAALLPMRALGLLAVVATLVALGLGVAGWSVGMREMEAALQHASPEHVDQVREVGGRIARTTLVLAAFAVPGLVAGIVGLVRARRPRPG